MENQEKVEKALTDAVYEIDVKLIRKAKADMFRCSAVCCDDNSKSLMQVQRCTEDCAKNIINIEKYVMDKLTNFNERFERASKDCYDNIRDKMPSNPTEDEKDKFKYQYEQCLSKQVEENLKKLPNLIKKIIDEGNRL